MWPAAADREPTLLFVNENGLKDRKMNAFSISQGSFSISHPFFSSFMTFHFMGFKESESGTGNCCTCLEFRPIRSVQTNFFFLPIELTTQTKKNPLQQKKEQISMPEIDTKTEKAFLEGPRC